MYVCRAVRMSDDYTLKLNEANKNHESVVARKDVELKEYQERYIHTYVHTYIIIHICIYVCTVRICMHRHVRAYV